jgi:hypothetical protein
VEQGQRQLGDGQVKTLCSFCDADEHEFCEGCDCGCLVRRH